MRMKQARLRTIQHRLQPRRISKPVDPPVRRLAGRADDGDALGEHNLVPAMRVQVSGAHEAGLRGVGVDPAEDHEVFGVAVVEDGGFVDRLAGVGGGGLFGDEEAGDEEGVGDEGAAEDAAGFEVAAGVGGGEGEEAGAEFWGEEEGAEGGAVL